jgi:hypothetical protein
LVPDLPIPGQEICMKTYWHRTAMACSLLACVSCASAPRQRPLPVGKADTGPGTTSSARQFLQGRWSLLSMDLFPPNEPVIHVIGSGVLTYDNFANMTVDLRLDPATASLFERIGIPAPNGVVSTTGRTLVDMTTQTLSYTLEGQQAVRPATHPLDTNRPRYWEVLGNTLTLRTKDGTGAVLSVAVWQKQ